MAQLRDSQTSELIIEETPLTVALIAERVGVVEVLFDGVGSGFNSSQLRDIYAKEIRDAIATNDPEVVDRVRHAERQARDLEAPATAAMQAARDRVGRRGGRTAGPRR